MKKILLLFISLTAMTMEAAAQDVVVDNYGTKYNCYITGEDEDNVFFRYEKDGVKVDTAIARQNVFNYRYNITYNPETPGIDKKNALSVGLLAGGSSAVGVEYERYLGKRCGLQIGAGFCGASVGFNVHFFPTIRSSYASIQAWYTGFVPDNKNYFWGHENLVVGPSVTYRNVTGWFYGTFGLGYVVESGDAVPSWAKDFPVDIKLSLGAYFPLGKSKQKTTNTNNNIERR